MWKRWRGAASMKVSKIVWDKEECKVIERFNTFQEDHEEKEEARKKVSKPKTNIVYPTQWGSTCEKWSEFSYLCRHACRFFRQHLKILFVNMLQCHTHYYYWYGTMKQLYKENVSLLSLKI